MLMREFLYTTLITFMGIISAEAHMDCHGIWRNGRAVKHHLISNTKTEAAPKVQETESCQRKSGEPDQKVTLSAQMFLGDAISSASIIGGQMLNSVLSLQF
jgi:hypothetical protein